MVDIDLVRGRPAPEVAFRTSLAADLITVIDLVLSAPHIEGLDQWVYATHAALPPELEDDLEAILFLTQKSVALFRWINQLEPDHPAQQDFAEFIGWLDGFSRDDFAQVITGTLDKLTKHWGQEEGAAPPALDDPQVLKAHLQEKFGAEQAERIVQLVKNPGELKTQFITTITRFWERFYRQQYQRCRSLMQRSVEHHQRQNYGTDLVSVFTAVTGRRLPEGYDEFKDAERVIFIPSCYIGPWVTFKIAKEPRLTLMVHYNCRPTGTPETDQVPAIQDLFPPIKALADETRLQILSMLSGRQLYAQEIVDQLDISQSAVSRHLKLMVTGGLLNVRKEDSMKYFSINEETLSMLAERLRDFRGI